MSRPNVTRYLPALLALGLACNSQDLTGPTPTTLRITASTTGAEIDPDGYLLVVDGQERGTLAADGISLVVAPGSHAVKLAGVSNNCVVEGDNPRSLTVAAAESASVSFVIQCVSPERTIRVEVSTQGSPADTNGYVIVLDGGVQSLPAQNNSVVFFQNLTQGAHRVELADVDSYCELTSSEPVSVSVSTGTQQVSLSVRCSENTGGIAVNVRSTSQLQGLQNYLISLDGQPAVHLKADGSHVFVGVSPHSYQVRLTGLPSACQPDSSEFRLAEVHTDTIITVDFAVRCYDDWTSLPLPDGFTPSGGLWAASASDIYVSGWVGTRAVILHSDGQTWSRQMERDSVRLYSIWGASPSNVYAAGEDYRRGRQGPVLHYDGHSWSDLPSPRLPAGDARNAVFLSLWGAADGSLFTAGWWRLVVSEDYWEASPLLAREFAGDWNQSVVDLPGLEPGMGDVAGLSPTDVYAIGRSRACDGCHGHLDFLLHYNGGGWVQVGGSTQDQYYQALWVTGPNDVWIAGEDWRGASWVGHFRDGQEVEHNPYNIPEFDTPGYGSGFHDIWGTSDEDIYAVGPSVMHFDGTSWTEIHKSAGIRIWGLSNTDLFVLTPTSVLHRHKGT